MVRQTRHLWIGNLPDKISEDRIKEHFKRYGRVQNIKMLPPESSLSTEADSYTSTSQPVLSSSSSTACTVAFMDIQSAAKALSFEHQIDNRLLTTRYYEPSSVTVTISSTSQQQPRSNRTDSPVTVAIPSSSLSPVVSSSASSSSTSSSSSSSSSPSSSSPASSSPPPTAAASPTIPDDVLRHRSQRRSRSERTSSSPLRNGVVVPATNSNGGCDYTRVTESGQSGATTSGSFVSATGASGNGSASCGAVGGSASSRHLQPTNSLNASSVAASQLHHFGSSSSRRGFFAPAPPSTPSSPSLPSAVAVVAAAAANLYGNGPHRVWPLSTATSTPVSYDNNRSSSSSSSISRNHHRTNSSIDLNDDILLRRKVDRHSHRKHIKSRSLNRSSDDKSRSGSKSDSFRSRSHSRTRTRTRTRTRSRSANSRSRSRSRSLLSRRSKMSPSRSRTRSRNRSRSPRSRSRTRSSSSSSALSSSSSPASPVGFVSSGFDVSVEAAASDIGRDSTIVGRLSPASSLSSRSHDSLHSSSESLPSSTSSVTSSRKRKSSSHRSHRQHRRGQQEQTRHHHHHHHQHRRHRHHQHYQSQQHRQSVSSTTATSAAAATSTGASSSSSKHLRRRSKSRSSSHRLTQLHHHQQQLHRKQVNVSTNHHDRSHSSSSHRNHQHSEQHRHHTSSTQQQQQQQHHHRHNHNRNHSQHHYRQPKSTISNTNQTFSSLSSSSSSSSKRSHSILLQNLPNRYSDAYLRDSISHECRKFGKTLYVRLSDQQLPDRRAVVRFKKSRDARHALDLNLNKSLFGSKIDVVSIADEFFDDSFGDVVAAGASVSSSSRRAACSSGGLQDLPLNEFHPKSSRMLTVSNLDKDFSVAELRKRIECLVGDKALLLEIDVRKATITTTTSSIATCEFLDIVSVVKVLRDGFDLLKSLNNSDDLVIRLEFGKSVISSCVWVDFGSALVAAVPSSGTSTAPVNGSSAGGTICDLSKFDEKFLNSVFDKYGSVTHVSVDKSRHRALVFYDMTTAAQACVHEMRGYSLKGQRLQVDFASRLCQDAFYLQMGPRKNSDITDDLLSLRLSNVPKSGGSSSRYSKPKASPSSTTLVTTPSSTPPRQTHANYHHHNHHSHQHVVSSSSTSSNTSGNKNQHQTAQNATSSSKTTHSSSTTISKQHQSGHASHQYKVSTAVTTITTAMTTTMTTTMATATMMTKTTTTALVSTIGQSTLPTTVSNEVSKSTREQSTTTPPSCLALSSAAASTTVSGSAAPPSQIKTAFSVTSHTSESEPLEKRDKRNSSYNKALQSASQAQHSTSLLSPPRPPPPPALLAASSTSRKQLEQVPHLLSYGDKQNKSNCSGSVENSLKSSKAANAAIAAMTGAATTAATLSAANVIPSSIYATSSLTNSILDSISNSHRNELSNATPVSDPNSSLSSRPGTPLCDEKPQELNDVVDPRKQAYSTLLSAISCTGKRVPLDLPLPLFADQRSVSETARNSTTASAPSSATPTHSSSHFDLFHSATTTTASSLSTSTTVSASLNSPATSPYSQPYITPLTIKTLQTHNALLSRKEAEEAAATAAAASAVANGNLLRKSSLAIFGSGENAIGTSSHHQYCGQTRLLSDINEHYYGNQQSHQLLQSNPKSPKSSSCVALEIARSPSLSSTSSSSSSSPRHRLNDSSQLNDILDERVRKVSELYAKWDNDGRVASAASACGGISSFLSAAAGTSASHSHMTSDDARTSKSLSTSKSELLSNYKPLVEFENPKNAEPDQIVEMMLSRPSIFDEDSKRLESTKEKFEIKNLQQFMSSPSGSAVAAVLAAAVSSSVSKLTTAVTAGTAETAVATMAAAVHTTSVSASPLNTLPNGLLKKSLLMETGAAKSISATKTESRLVPILKKDTSNMAIAAVNNSPASETKKTPVVDAMTTKTKTMTLMTTTTTPTTTTTTTMATGLATMVTSSCQSLPPTPHKSILKVTSPTKQATTIQTTQSMGIVTVATSPPSAPLQAFLASPNARLSDMEGASTKTGRGGSTTPTRPSHTTASLKSTVRRPPSPPLRPLYDLQAETTVNDDNKTKDDDKKTRDKLLREQQHKERDWFQFASKSKSDCDNVVSISNPLNTTNQSQRVQKVAVTVATTVTVSSASMTAKVAGAATSATASATKTVASDIAKKSLTVPATSATAQKHASFKTEKKPSTPPIASVPIPIPSPTLSTSSSSTTSSTKSSNVAKVSASASASASATSTSTSLPTKTSTSSSTKSSQKSKTKNNCDLSSIHHSHGSNSNSNHHHHHHHGSSSGSNHHHHHGHADTKNLSKASKKSTASDGTKKIQSPTSAVSLSTSKLIAAKKKTQSQQENVTKKKKQLQQVPAQSKDSASGQVSASSAPRPPPPPPSSTASPDSSSTSSSDDDSDGNRKKSIFEIEQEPSYISMYDKVKARSCKNKQQKQESEKMEIKAKFHQLKQSRAKREEKKRPGSCDEETRFTASGATSKSKSGHSSGSSLFGNRQRSSFSGQSDDKKRFMVQNSRSSVKDNHDDGDSTEEVEESESRIPMTKNVAKDDRNNEDDGDDADDDDVSKNVNDEEIIDENNDDEEIDEFDKLRTLKNCHEKRRKMFVKKKKKKLIDSSSSDNESFSKSFSRLSPNQKKSGSKKKSSAAVAAVAAMAGTRAVNWNNRYSDDTHSEADEAMAEVTKGTFMAGQNRLTALMRSPNADAASATANSALNTADECSTDFDIEKKKMKKPMIAATLRKKMPKQHHNNHRHRKHRSNSSTSDMSGADGSSVADKDEVTSRNKTKLGKAAGYRHQSKTQLSSASYDDTDNNDQHDQHDNEDVGEIDSSRHHHHHRRPHRRNYYSDDSKKAAENRDHFSDDGDSFLSNDACDKDDGENNSETVDRPYLYENKRDNVVVSGSDQQSDRALHQKLDLHEFMQSKSVVPNIENDENIEERKQKKQHKRKRHEKREKRRKRHRVKDEKKLSYKELSAAEQALKKAEEAIFGSISDMNDEDDDEDDEDEDDYEDGIVGDICSSVVDEQKGNAIDESGNCHDQTAGDLKHENSLLPSPEIESTPAAILESAKSYSQNVEDRLARHKRKRKRKHHHSSGYDKETKISILETVNVSNRDLLFVSDNETNKEDEKETTPEKIEDETIEGKEGQRVPQMGSEAGKGTLTVTDDDLSKTIEDKMCEIVDSVNDRMDASCDGATNVGEKVEIDAADDKDRVFDELKKGDSANVVKTSAIEAIATVIAETKVFSPEKQFRDDSADSHAIQTETESPSAMLVEVKTEEEMTAEPQLMTEAEAEAEANTEGSVLEAAAVPILEAPSRNRISISNEETMNAIAAILSPSFSQDHMQTTYDEVKSCSIVAVDSDLVATSSETGVSSYENVAFKIGETLVSDQSHGQVKDSGANEDQQADVKSDMPCDSDTNGDDAEPGTALAQVDVAIDNVNLGPNIPEDIVKTSPKEDIKTITIVPERDVSVIVQNETVTAYNAMSLIAKEQIIQPEVFLQNAESSVILTKPETESELEPKIEEKPISPIRTAQIDEIRLQSEFREEMLEKIDDFVVRLERPEVTQVENRVRETPIVMPDPIVVEPQLQPQLEPQHEVLLQSDKPTGKIVPIEPVIELKVPTIERSLPALVCLKPEEKYILSEQDCKTPKEKPEGEATDQMDLSNHLPESVISLKHPIASPKSPILPNSPTEMLDYVDSAQKTHTITTRTRGRGRGRGGRVGRPAGSGKKRGLITSSNLSNASSQPICHPTPNQVPKTSSYNQKKHLITSNPISGFNDDVYEFQDETDDNHHLMEYSADVFFEKQSKDAVSTNIRSNDAHSKKAQVVASRKSKRIQERNGSGISRDSSSVTMGSFDEVVDEDGHHTKIRRSSRHNSKVAAASASTSASASAVSTSAGTHNKLFGPGSASVITKTKPSLLTSVAAAKTTMTMTSSYDQNNRKDDYDELNQLPAATITTTTLIDPVTGVLTPMRQKDDGKYVAINVHSASGFVRSVPDEIAPVKKRLSRNSYCVPDINHRSPSIPTTVSASIPSSAAVTQLPAGQTRVTTPTVTPPPQAASPSLSSNAMSQAPSRQSLKKHILERTRQEEQQVLMQQRETELGFMNASNSTMETAPPLPAVSSNYGAAGLTIGTGPQGPPATLPPTSPPAKASVAIQTPTSLSHSLTQQQLYAAPNYCASPHPFVHPRIIPNVISPPMSSPSSAMPPPHCPSPKQIISSQSINFLGNEERMASTASVPTIATSSAVGAPTSGHDFYQALDQSGLFNRSSATASISPNHTAHNFVQKQQSLLSSGTVLQNKRHEYLQQHFANPHSSVGYVGSPRTQVSQFDHSLTPNSNAIYPILSPPVAHQHPISGSANTTPLTTAEQQQSSHSIYYEKASQQPKLPESAALPLPQASVVEFNNLSESRLLQQYYERSRVESDTASPMPTKHGDDHKQQLKQQSANPGAAAYQNQTLAPAAQQQQQHQQKPSTTTTTTTATNQLQSNLSRTAQSPPMLALMPRFAPSQASQIPPQADSLFAMLQQQCPIMWQGLLSIKSDQAAVQMYYISGNQEVSRNSLPFLSDSVSAPLRIVQRMRLDQTQVEGVCRKMQTKSDHCILLALPCGKDHVDVVNQSKNLQTGFIQYLQQKQAAGIVNVTNNNLGTSTASAGSASGPDAAYNSESASGYIIHIFPKCDFVNEHLSRINPNLLHKVANLSHLFVIIVTV